MEPRFARELAFLRFTQHPDNVLWTYLFHQHQDSCLNNNSMGRPKDFPNIYQDLLTKYKAKGIADKEYKEYLAMARVRINRTGSLRCCFVSDTFAPLEQEQGLSKEARLGDISSTLPTAHLKQSSEQKRESSVKKEKPESSGAQLKKQRVSGAFSHSEKVILLWLQ